MPRNLSRRLALTAIVTTLALFVTALAAAAASPGAVSFNSATYEVDEGAGNATVTLSRSGGTDGVLTAKVTLSDVTTNAADYRFAPGGLDTTFGGGTRANSLVRVITQQPDGKIIVGGSFTTYGGTARNGLARLSADGVLDTTFVPPSLAGSDVWSLALQPDGKLLVGGIVSHEAGVGQRTGITRLNPDGSTDATFNPGTGTGSDFFVVTLMTLQPDGKVVIAGNFTSFNGVARSYIARLNADGSVDATFNAGAASHGASITAVLLQPDDKILVGGVFTQFNGLVRNRLVRLNTDGGVDTTFDPGTAVEKFYVEALTLEPGGKIIAGGAFPVGATFGGANPTALARLNTDGSADPSFLDPGLGAKFRTDEIVRQADGKLLVGGTFLPDFIGGQIFYSLDRLNADGGDDPTFKSGLVAHSNSTLNALAVQPNGRVLVGGRFSLHPFGEPYAYLVRLENDLFVTWGAGDAADKTVTLPVVNDAASEDDETLGLTLTPLTEGAGSGPLTAAALKILDNDGKIQFTSTTYSAGEGAGTFLIPVARVGGSSVASSVTYSFLGGSASNGTDYTGTTGTLNFAPGETTKNIPLPLIDNNVNELNESLSVSLDTFTNVTRGTPTFAILSIVDDDPLPSIAVGDATVTEGDGGSKTAVFTVTRTGLIDRTLGFIVRTADGTAVAGEDFVALNSTVQMSPSQSSVNVSVSVLGDTIVEPDKSFFLNIVSASQATVTRSQGVGEIKDNDTTTGVPTVQFAAREVKASEGSGVATVTVTRSGDASAPATVAYTTFFGGSINDLPADERGDYNLSLGTLSFAAGETSKTIKVFVTDDVYVEGPEVFSVGLSAPTGGATLGVPSTSVVRILDNDAGVPPTNPIDDTAFFVRQHYRDFLNRDPDAEGLAFWTGEIEQCGADAQCREVKRINVSAAFFLSIEFRETGYFVYLLYKAAFNTGERLTMGAFQGDSQQIGKDVVVGATGWEQKLASNKQAFADALVARAQFAAAYPQSMTPEQFVDKLDGNTGDPLNPAAGGALTKAERDRLVSELSAGTLTRAQALRAVAENDEFRRRQLGKAFVLMQYFGYLRRAPNEPPDLSFDGYNFWLGKLNEFQGNYINAEMVKAFITSEEYRNRFGQ